MPNLSHTQALHKIYKPNSLFAKLDSGTSLPVNESINPERLEKAFLTLYGRLGPNFVMYFESGLDAEVALLYIDICSFSTRYRQLSSEKLANFLDQYYEKIIPIIYEFGGEIDRIMGDGIVVIFGPPFLEGGRNSLITKSLACSVKILALTYDTEYYSKIAIHAGKIRYYKNKSVQYPEFTIIGKPITELYRLESIADENSITYYSQSSVDEQIELLKKSKSFPACQHPRWSCTPSQLITPALRGVGYKHVRHITRI